MLRLPARVYLPMSSLLYMSGFSRMLFEWRFFIAVLSVVASASAGLWADFKDLGDLGDQPAKSPGAQGAGRTSAPRSGVVAADHAAKMTRGLEVFKKHVQPILVKNCVRCHGGKKTEGELDLTDREGLLRGGGRGPAILVGNAQDSLLYNLITHARDPHLPRAGGKLSDEAGVHIGFG